MRVEEDGDEHLELERVELMGQVASGDLDYNMRRICWG